MMLRLAVLLILISTAAYAVDDDAPIAAPRIKVHAVPLAALPGTKVSVVLPLRPLPPPLADPLRDRQHADFRRFLSEHPTLPEDPFEKFFREHGAAYKKAIAK